MRSAGVAPPGAGESAAASACSGSWPGRIASMSQVVPPGLLRRAGNRPAKTKDDLPLPEPADHRDQPVRLDLGGDVQGPVVPPEEEGGILLAKRQEAAIRADRGFDVRGTLGRLAVDRGDQVLQLVRVVDASAQIDPGLKPKEAFGLVVEAGQEDRDDRKVVLPGLAIEGDLDLAVLPGAHALAEEHGDRAGPAELFLEERLPGLAGRQVGAIEEASDAGFGQARTDRRDRARIGTAVTEENVARDRRNHGVTQ
jgi:hypothetical protein